MKKIICILLSVIMVFSCFTVVFADNENDAEKELVNVDGATEIPVVLVSGDSTPIVNKDGKQALQYKNFLSDTYRGEVLETLKAGLKEMIYPLVVEGMLTDNWDNFYDKLYDMISSVFKETLLDENGEIPTDPASPGYKTDLDPMFYEINNNAVNRTFPENYKYSHGEFWFFYDWRLDPFVTAEKLHEYIQDVKKATGHDKVGLIGRCLGSSIVMTYVSVYGMEDLMGVAINGSVVNGAEALSEPISGKFELDMNAIVRFLEDANGTNLLSIDQIIIDLLDMLEKSGFYGMAKETAEKTLYQKFVGGITSSLALSTFFTWPSYWTGVAPNDYQDALYYVFGPQGSEKRQQYAGLIEKLDKYDREVRQRLPEIYAEIDEGGNLGIMSKYEFQIVPLITSHDKIGDQFASVEYTSVGATTSSVYDTLGDEYIAKREFEGKGKYISPDKQIDASTCLYPDYTWFVKGSSHSNWSSIENYLLAEVVTAPEQITVDDTIYSQFMVYDYDTDTMEAMTEENCDKVFFTANKEEDLPKNIFVRIKVFFKSVITFMKSLIAKLSELSAK